MALAIAAMPLAAQAKDTAAAGGPGSSVSGAPASPNESDLVIPDSGSNARAQAQGQNAPAGGANPAQAAQPAAPGVSTWDFVRMLIILAAVVGAIYLLFWILRKSSGRKIAENELIRVLGSRSLPGNRSLHLVEVGTSVYLIGSSDGGVELISEITDKESLDSVRLKAAEETPRQNAASSRSCRRSSARPRVLSATDGLGFLRGQRDRLKKL